MTTKPQQCKTYNYYWVKKTYLKISGLVLSIHFSLQLNLSQHKEQSDTK